MDRIAVPLLLINLNDEGFHLLAEISVFGEKHFAVIDTGASRSVFDSSFILQYGAESSIPQDTQQATTIFTTSATALAVIPKLKIGGLTIKDYPAIALDLASVNEAYDLLGHPRIIGIIGSDIFYRYQARINFKKLKLYFSKK